MEFIDSDYDKELATIKVFGIGDGGSNAVQHMIDNKFERLQFICVNTNAQALEYSSAQHTVQLGSQIAKGIGTNGNPELGRKAAEESTQEIADLLNGADIIFIVATMGGGTGTGAAPVIAEMAKERGIFTIGVVTTPCSAIENERIQIATTGIEKLRKSVDSLIVIPHERLNTMVSAKTQLSEIIIKAHETFLSTMRGITEFITEPGDISIDISDMQNAMRGTGAAFVGEGLASGEKRALEATKKALCSPSLKDINIANANAIFINIVGTDISMEEFCEVSDYLSSETTDIFICMNESDSVNPEIRVTMLVTGVKLSQ